MAASPSSDEYVQFRDGLPYASNLVAVRQVIDEVLAKANPETSSVTLLWQLALRELSRSSANPEPIFQSSTWQKRVMNTQLASFTQLRHDTILYAKQSFCATCMCEYPTGFVDPYPSFWRKMHELAKRTLTIIESLHLVREEASGKRKDHSESKSYRCLTNFANAMDKLFEIATTQAQHEDLTEAQEKFLKSIMKETGLSGGSRFEGWYPSLFYTEPEDSDERDHLVADVHTNLPSDEHGDPGGILHMGVGNVNLAMVVVDETLYAGPVFSHYEFVTPTNERLTDEAFSKRLPTLQAPKWATESFLVTKPSPIG